MAIVLAVLATLGVQGMGDADRQKAFLTIVLVWMAAGLGGAVWLLLLSRIPRRRAGAILGCAVLAGVVVAGLVRIRGTSGDLVPILEWRWAGSKDIGIAPELPPEAVPDEPLPGLADYPQFFGPDRDGKLPGPPLVRDWSANPPTELWRRPVGEGWSGFAVAGRRAVTQEQHGGEEAVICYDVESGRVLWVHRDNARYFTTLGGLGPRATPTLHQGRVYSQGATGILNCLDLASGEVIWSKNIVEDNGAKIPEWGVAGSPLIWKDRVVVSAGGPQGRSLVAYRQEDGERVWSGGSDSANWSSPVACELAGREQILIFNARHIAGHDASNGKLLWEHPWKTGHPHVALPRVLPDDRVLVSSGYGTGAQLLKIGAPKEGDEFPVTRLWRSLHLKAKFANYLEHGGHIYGLDDGIMVCVNPDTGRREWKDGRYGHGQMILVDDVLLLTTERGEIVLVEPTPEEHRELTRFEVFDSKTWNPPALAGEYLLVRNDKEAACLKLPVVESAGE